MRRSLVVAGAALVGAVVSAAPARGQGSSVYTHSACATGLAGAGVAAPCADASAVFYNPAALAMQPSAVSLGVTAITTSGDFTYDFTGETVERDAETVPVPALFASYRLNDRLALGFGAWAPYGLGIEWPLEFEGRFAGYDNQLQGIYLQPTVAYQLGPSLSLGGGVDFVRGAIEINQRVDLATTPLPTQPFPGRVSTFGNLGIPLGTDFADATLEGNGWGTTWHIGLVGTVSEQLSFGFRYLHSVELDFDEGDATFRQVPTGLVIAPVAPPGTPSPLNPTPNPLPVDAIVAAQFAEGGPLSSQTVSTGLTLPNQAVFGISFRPVPSLNLLADYQYIGWDTFHAASIDFERAPDASLILDYRSTDTYRLGAELGVTDALDLRAGFIYNTAAEEDASVSPLLPEAERNYYTAGIGYQLGNGLRADLAYQYIDQADRRGRVRPRASFAQTAEQLNVGVYGVDAHLFGLTVAYPFGSVMRSAR